MKHFLNNISHYSKMYMVKCLMILAALCSSSAYEEMYQTSEDIKEETHLKCSILFYSSTCFKLDLLRLMANLGKKTKINLMSGITLLSTERTRHLVHELELATRILPRTDLNKFLWDSAVKYIGSLNITMRLDQTYVLHDMKSISENVWSGRGRKGWYAVGTLAAVMFAMLATLAGKALMASMLALFISGISTMRGGNAGGGSPSHYGSPSAYGKVTQYDIISKPYVSGPYIDHDHHHYNMLTDTQVYSGRGIGLARKGKEKKS